MMQITKRAPCRIDLAGGTLDIHPVYLFIPEAVTVNLAIDIGVDVTLETIAGEKHAIDIADRGLAFAYDPRDRATVQPGAELVLSVLDHFQPALTTALRIVTHSHSPAGAGLAASSALCAGLVTALLELTGRRLPLNETVQLCLDLEARILKTPAGYQDFYAALEGGLQEIVFAPGAIAAAPIAADLEEIARRVLLVYTGVPHHSGLNNWEILKAFIDGDVAVRGALGEIGMIAAQMAGALRSGDWRAAAALLAREWRWRKTLSPGTSTPVIDALIAAAESLGGAGKVCGAGGGGCLILWHDGRGAAEAALHTKAEELGVRILPWAPVRQGCRGR